MKIFCVMIPSLVDTSLDWFAVLLHLDCTLARWRRAGKQSNTSLDFCLSGVVRPYSQIHIKFINQDYSNQVYSLNLFTRHVRYVRYNQIIYVRYIHYHLFTREAYSNITTFFLPINILNDNLYDFTSVHNMIKSKSRGRCEYALA